MSAMHSKSGRRVAAAQRCIAALLLPDGHLDTILWIAAASILLAGLARVFFGMKGVQFYALNWLLYTKVVLFALVASLQVVPSRHYHHWLKALPQTGLPSEREVRDARRKIMTATHLVAIIPLPAVFLARGFGYL